MKADILFNAVIILWLFFFKSVCAVIVYTGAPITWVLSLGSYSHSLDRFFWPGTHQWDQITVEWTSSTYHHTQLFLGDFWDPNSGPCAYEDARPDIAISWSLLWRSWAYALTFSNYVASVAQRMVQLGHGTLSLFCLDKKDEQLANGRTSRCLEF